MWKLLLPTTALIATALAERLDKIILNTINCGSKKRCQNRPKLELVPYKSIYGRRPVVESRGSNLKNKIKRIEVIDMLDFDKHKKPPHPFVHSDHPSLWFRQDAPLNFDPLMSTTFWAPSKQVGGGRWDPKQTELHADQGS